MHKTVTFVNYVSDPKKTYLSEFFFWTHSLIFAGLIVPFAIPATMWSSRVVYHFWYITGLACANILWGIVLRTKLNKYAMVCPWTTFTQWLRGFDISHEKNYDHSFISELSEFLGYKLSVRAVNLLLVAVFLVAFLQYIVLA